MYAMLMLTLCVFIHQLEGIFIKKYNSKRSKGGFIFTALVSLFSMLFFLVTDKGGLDFRAEMIPYAVIAAICYFSASFLTYVAFGCGSYVMSNLILSYSLILSIGYGLFFLGDPVTPLTIPGLIIVFVSIFLVRGQKKDGESGFSAKWLICILLSALGSGMFAVISKMQQLEFNNEVTNEFMIVSLGISALVLFIAGLIKEGKDLGYILKNGGLYAVGSGLSNGATNFLSLYVNTLMVLSLKAPANAGIKIVMSFILAKLLFKEKFIKRQIVGVILGTVALVLLNIKF